MAGLVMLGQVTHIPRDQWNESESYVFIVCPACGGLRVVQREQLDGQICVYLQPHERAPGVVCEAVTVQLETKEATA